MYYLFVERRVRKAALMTGSTFAFADIMIGSSTRWYFEKPITLVITAIHGVLFGIAANLLLSIIITLCWKVDCHNN